MTLSAHLISTHEITAQRKPRHRGAKTPSQGPPEGFRNPAQSAPEPMPWAGFALAVRCNSKAPPRGDGGAFMSGARDGHIDDASDRAGRSVRNFCRADVLPKWSLHLRIP
jgi:hypothetical protein